jgi:hypothetical protein
MRDFEIEEPGPYDSWMSKLQMGIGAREMKTLKLQQKRMGSKY